MLRWPVILLLALPLAALAAESPPADASGGRPAAIGDEPPAAISHWAETHPAALHSLADWALANPDAARQVVWWDHWHPVRAQDFLRWLLEHPTQSVDDFAAAHEAWPATSLVLRPNREALAGLTAWARAHPAALQDLLSEPRGLAWVGFHALTGLWKRPPPDPASPAER